MHQEIIKTLLYFDIFKYPLTKAEIRKYVSYQASESDINNAISSLLSEGKIYCFDNLYSLHNDISSIESRLECNKRAQDVMPKAISIGKRIEKFPFVRAVNLSGSISKDVMHLDSDLDYFVITEKNRLWLAKLFLVLFKRLFLLNSKKDFCINYFISESNLKIQERNIFTSIELASMIPVSDHYWHERLLSENPWIRDYCKNFDTKSSSAHVPISKPFWSRALYSLLKGKLGDRLEKRVMKSVYNKNKQKYANDLSVEDFELMFRTNEVQAKVHNSNHQGKILDLYAEKVKKFESRYNLPISEIN